MAMASMWKDGRRAGPRLFRARMGGLLFALAVVLAVIWLLGRVQ